MNEFLSTYYNVVKNSQITKTDYTPGLMANTLRMLVQEEGRDVYRDSEKLAQYLRGKGIHENSIKQAELVLCGSSLLRYMDQLSNGLSAIDINNILITAMEAGLSNRSARNTVYALLYGLGVPQFLGEYEDSTSVVEGNQNGLYVPPSMYVKQLNEISNRISQKNASQIDFSTLNQYVSAGIPRAYTIMGRAYLVGSGVPADENKAKEYLEYASEHGEAEATSLLADYYFNRNDLKAYHLYTRPGALALNKDQWAKFAELNTRRMFYNTQMWLMVGVFLLLEVLMFLFSTSAVTGSHDVARNVCTFINLINLAGIIAIHVKNPYQDLRNFCVPMILSFFVYTMILI